MAAMDDSQTIPGLIITRLGKAGIITLNRPQTLNALDLVMLRGMSRLLTEWAGDETVRTVIVRSASARAFCAGGDIRALRNAVLEQRFHDVETFFATEYGLSALIGAYPKPYVALIDGYCMGGGMGISMHGGQRIVAEDAVLAMPETLIGFYPDVGANHVLSRLKAGMGLYLALTGTHVGAADALSLGLATNFVPRSAHAALANALAAGEPAALAVRRFSTPVPAPGTLGPLIPDIARHFAGASSALEIIRSLEQETGAFAAETLSILRARCPTSLAVTFENIRRGAHLDLDGALALEQHLCLPMARRPDYAEGIRATVVDKDHTPRWNPARLEDIDLAGIADLYKGASG